MATRKDSEGSSIGRIAAFTAIAILVILFFGYSFSATPPFWSFAPQASAHFTVLWLFLDRVFYVFVAGLICFASLQAGLFILGLLRVEGLRPVEKGVLALGLGLGVLSLSTLAAGLAGILTQPVAIVMVVVMAAVGTGRSGRLVRGLDRSRGPRFSGMEIVLGACAVLAALLTLAYAFNPPMYFDALEYHLSVPAHYFSTGVIRYIRYNVYSNFPGNSEMLYLFSMTLVGSKFDGAILGKVISGLVALAAAGSVYSLGKWLSSRAAGLFAAAALLTAGGFFQVATGVYVEPLQTLYTVLAVLAVGRFLARGDAALLTAGALSAGLAVGVKYPAVVFVVVPLFLAVLARPACARARARNGAVFALVALAAWSPWIIKNLVFTGNPVYPLLWHVFGGRDWSALQDAKWAFAHTPKGGFAWQQWARHVFGLFFADDLVSLPLFLFAPLVFLRKALSRRVLYVLGWSLLYIFLWFALTHRIDRFAVPGLAVMAAVSGAGLFSPAKGRARQVLLGLGCVLLAMNLFYISCQYGHTLDINLSVPLFGKYDEILRKDKPEYKAWMEINKLVAPGSRVLLVGEPETFYLDFGYSATTVFDRKPFEEIASAQKDPADIARAVKAAGFDYIFVNWATFRRQQESYSFKFEGHKHPGYSSVVSPALFERLTKADVIKAVYSSGPEIYRATPCYVLYLVK